MVRGIHDDKVFMSLDEGRKRSPGDVLHLSGATADNARTRVSAARIVYQMVQCEDVSHFRMLRRHFQNRALIEFADTIKGWLDQAMNRTTHARGLCTPSVLLAASAILIRIDPGQAEHFLRQLTSGFFTEEGNAACVLRKTLLATPHRSDRISRLTSLALIFKAWQLHCQNKTCEHLRWQETTGGFPVPAGFEQSWRHSDECVSHY